jgi:tRNA threonylcarbamoyladenosine biosynthesis protein TsaE
METRALAARLASLCRPGDVIVLSGGLGVGKTTFVGGLADGLGVEEPITSPTFVLMRTYSSGFLPLVHVDVYRIGSALEFDDLEVFELGRDGVVAIEWGDVIGAALPLDRLHVELSLDETAMRGLSRSDRSGNGPSVPWPRSVPDVEGAGDRDGHPGVVGGARRRSGDRGVGCPGRSARTFGVPRAGHRLLLRPGGMAARGPGRASSSTSGPGLYTGIRVGLATAQGLAAAIGVPLLTAVSLDAIALRAATGHRHIWAVVDVRRTNLAVASYHPVPGGVVKDALPR